MDDDELAMIEAEYQGNDIFVVSNDPLIGRLEADDSERPIVGVFAEDGRNLHDGGLPISVLVGYRPAKGVRNQTRHNANSPHGGQTIPEH